MTQRKLIVAGCSFSDYLQNNRTVYGCELAKKLGFKYQHEGAGCGSNWRIWRRITEAVMQAQLTNRDLVIIQYTGLERREFWTRYPGSKPSIVIGRPIREPYDDGYLIRYKAQAETWQDHPEECDFFRVYEQDHVCIAYERELFEQEHFKFQLLLKHYDIPAIFINGRHTVQRPLNLISPYKMWAFDEPIDWAGDVDTWYHDQDSSHLCDSGHEQLADLLKAHIDNYSILNCYN